MTNGILIGIGSTIGALVLVALAALVARQWKSPKRLDRLDAVVPMLARGILALLEFHIFGDTNGSKQTMKKSWDELRTITTDKMVSQKAGK